ncbi:hypothetical protein OPV22_020433 [Ensete ventricosum]|uniref:Uncharacterized protein n=1 Tax=Ensete ventricosum TaxID=4639 RepID=A0AAV8P9X2_ENSVE|nr:hypothetical protein OPV22_020433 [Ensete ventricosum]
MERPCPAEAASLRFRSRRCRLRISDAQTHSPSHTPKRNTNPNLHSGLDITYEILGNNLEVLNVATRSHFQRCNESSRVASYVSLILHACVSRSNSRSGFWAIASQALVSDR